MMTVITKSARETKKLAALFLKRAFAESNFAGRGALVVGLEGNLGSGKTTFVQGVARALGVKENVLSPTFVLVKIYKIQKIKRFKHLMHIDCYRLDLPKDLLHLGFKNLLKDKDAIVLIEWADRVKKILPKDALMIRFHHLSPTQRKIVFSNETPYSH